MSFSMNMEREIVGEPNCHGCPGLTLSGTSHGELAFWDFTSPTPVACRSRKSLINPAFFAPVLEPFGDDEKINVDPADVKMRGLPFEIDVTADRRLARVIDDAASSSASWAAASQGLPPFMVQPSGLVSRDVEAFTLPNPLGVIAESR